MLLGPGDVGHRVVVRRIVGHREGRPLRSDLLGELVALTERELTVDTRHGRVTVPRRAVVAAKRVPPPPVRRRGTGAPEPADDEVGPPPGPGR